MVNFGLTWVFLGFFGTNTQNIASRAHFVKGESIKINNKFKKCVKKITKSCEKKWEDLKNVCFLHRNF